ncbi:MAG: transposase [Nevskiaceae bacterium]|nr:MAG: transposase [Nevskiaceae bacterium]
MDSSRCIDRHRSATLDVLIISSQREESDMESTLIAVDTAKLVFEVAEAGVSGRVSRRLRLNRAQFQEYLVTRERSRFVLEACGGAHHWARRMQRAGHEVRLLPVP